MATSFRRGIQAGSHWSSALIPKAMTMIETSAPSSEKRDAFSQQLPHDAPSSGADRRADDELTLPGDALSEKQPSDVGAGDEQHERRGTLEHLEGRAKKADLRFAYRLHLDPPALVPR
jgi:hypothetical protein